MCECHLIFDYKIIITCVGGLVCSDNVDYQ